MTSSIYRRHFIPAHSVYEEALALTREYAARDNAPRFLYLDSQHGFCSIPVKDWPREWFGWVVEVAPGGSVSGPYRIPAIRS